LLQGISCRGERGYFKNTRQREVIAIAADDNRRPSRVRGSLLLVCRRTGHDLSEAPGNQNALKK